MIDFLSHNFHSVLQIRVQEGQPTINSSITIKVVKNMHMLCNYLGCERVTLDERCDQLDGLLAYLAGLVVKSANDQFQQMLVAR